MDPSRMSVPSSQGYCRTRSTVDSHRFFSLGRPELCVPESYNPADHAITQISMNPETKDADLARITVGWNYRLIYRTLSAHSWDIREEWTGQADDGNSGSIEGESISVDRDWSLIFEEVTPPMETDAKSPKKKSRCTNRFYSIPTVFFQIRDWFLPSVACIVYAIVPDDPSRSGSTQSTMRPDCGEYRIPYRTLLTTVS